SSESRLCSLIGALSVQGVDSSLQWDELERVSLHGEVKVKGILNDIGLVFSPRRLVEFVEFSAEVGEAGRCASVLKNILEFCSIDKKKVAELFLVSGSAAFGSNKFYVAEVLFSL